MVWAAVPFPARLRWAGLRNERLRLRELARQSGLAVGTVRQELTTGGFQKCRTRSGNTRLRGRGTGGKYEVSEFRNQRRRQREEPGGGRRAAAQWGNGKVTCPLLSIRVSLGR